MPGNYRIKPRGGNFIVNRYNGGTVGVFKTRRKAKQEIENCERDDLRLETARGLIELGVSILMRVHGIDRQTASDWIREGAGLRASAKRT